MGREEAEMDLIYEALLIPEEDGGYSVYFPDWDSATCGDTLEEVAHMATDLLKMEVTYALANNRLLPKATFGNILEESSQSVFVAVSTSVEESKERWAYIQTSQAAQMLGITVGRVHQLITGGVLHAKKEGRDTYVSRADVEARLAAPSRAGRPRKRKKVAA